jgi:NADH:ubiquinone oxidoreductase subunit K
MGQINVLFILTVAVVESSLGLAFLMLLYKYRGAIMLGTLKGLKG